VWFFAFGALVLILLNWVLRPEVSEKYNVTWSWLQFLYALVSVEVCVAIYFYGVGSWSPHWRPDPPPKVAVPGAKAMFLAAKPGADGESHPLGPKLTKPLQPAAQSAPSSGHTTKPGS
jgi:hypothetical protein